MTENAVEDAGNQTVINETSTTLGAKLRLVVKETVPPSIVISSPTEGQFTSNSKPTVNFTVTDSGSGVDPSTIGVTIDNGNKIVAGITKTAITNGYQCSYSISESLADGSHTIYVDADDYDGNSATQRTVNFVVDTIPPELSVNAPVNNFVTNAGTVTVSGTAKDLTSGLISVTVRLNGGTDNEVTVNSDGSFSTQITLQEGANTITVTAQDAGGITSSVTRVVTLDTQAPVITDVEISPNPVSTGDVLSIQVTVTD